MTDQLRSYPAANAEIAELTNVKHVFVKASAQVNNRSENSHQPHTGTRASDARLPGSSTHPSIPLELRPNPAALRAQETFATRLALSQTARRALCRIASLH
ncbi:hypothetical protein BN2476_10028 [Paraburkholderia piptadeniae]|uniref:Uncharacterized protein n=1 Tax=Paraburkholderia piptadeniae TaxID=1701573 RepID=A0A1N7RIN2_9BURK|nr:hypothetical protein BN2476_10028 [Paraburkholderia piptadeniae]